METAALRRTDEDTPGLTLSIYGGRLVPLEVYTGILDQVRLALQEVDRLVLPGRQPRVRWGVRDIYRGDSVDILLEPLKFPRKREADSIALAPIGLVSGVEQLRHAAAIPTSLNLATVERVGRIADRVDGGAVERVELTSLNGVVHDSVVDRDTAANVRGAVTTVRRSYGSVSGTLDVLSARGKGTAAQILQEGTRTGVVVRPQGSVSSAQLRNAWEQRVLARGLLHRNAAGQVTKIDVDELHILEPRRSRDPRPLLGIDPDATGELSTGEFLALARA